MLHSNCALLSKILSACLGEADKLDVLHRSDMECEIANLCLDLLVEYNFICVMPGPSEFYKATQRGRELMELLESFEKPLP